MELYIVKQESLYLEKLVKNGGSKDVHYVVKNTPFTVHYGIKNFEEGSTFNFNKCKVDCSLMIDMNPPKDVDYISKKPMDYVIHPTKGGNECAIEFRVKVLTTQMEGSLFLIRTSLVGSNGKILEVITMPIKSVSKPEQVRRKMAKENNNSSVKSTPSRKKRTRSDELLETLQTIQTEQKQQSEMLNNVVGYMMNMGMYFNNLSQNMPMNNIGDNGYLEEKKSQDGQDGLEVAFNNLMTAYNKLNPSLRPTKMKKVMHDNKNSEELNEMVSIFGSIQNESVPQTNGSTHLGNIDSTLCFGGFTNEVELYDTYENTILSTNNNFITDTCNCPSCPARKELEQLNNFYMEFLQEDVKI